MRSRRTSLAPAMLVALGAAGCGSLLGLDDFTDAGQGGASSSSDGSSTASATASTVTSASSASSGGGGGGGGTACTDAVQCPGTDEACRVVVCEDGTCGFAVADDGAECDGGTCLDGACDIAPGCRNGQLDGNETDVDCGGSCPNCANRLNCDVGGDCISGYCPNGDDCAPCTTHAQCGDGRFCDPGGICREDKADGAPCDVADECTSGNCPGDDGVCCDAPCDGICETCGTGSCELVEQGSDPDEECARTDCVTGECGGDGRCETEPAGTICGPAATCEEGTQTLADTCDDSGFCVDRGETECGNYACNGAECRTTCVNDDQCADGFNCYAPDCEVPICAAPPCVLDARAYGGSLDTAATGVAVDPVSLDAFVAGTFSGLLAAGGPTSSGGTIDAFLARISPSNGSLVFTRALGGAGTQRGGEITRLANGSFAVSGSFATGVELDGVAGNELTPDGAGQTAGFVAQYDTNGTYVGSAQVGDVDPPYLPAPALASRGLLDDVYVGGANAGPNALCGQTAPPAGTYMALLGLLSSPGSCTDGYTLRPNPDTFDEYVTSVARRGNDVFASGASFDETIVLGPDSLYEASFLARFSAGLDPVWGRGNSLYNGSHVSAAPNDDSVVIAGYFDGGSGNFYFIDGNENRQLFTAVSEDLTFAKYDSNGEMLFARHISAPLDQRILAVTHLSDGRIVIAGSYQDSVVFGQNPDTGLTVSLPAASGIDGFVTAYDPEGAPLWTVRVSGAGDQQVTGLAVLPGDRLVAVGDFTQGASVGGVDLPSAGGTDMFLLRIATLAE